MKDSVVYVGIDVHKDTNSVCMYDEKDNIFFAEAKLDAGTDIMVKYLRKVLETTDFPWLIFVVANNMWP